MKFQKGQSGNPGGRPKEAGEVKELARAHTAEAIKTLASIMRAKRTPSAARVAAANALLDRGWGKAPQAITGEDGGPVQVDISLSDQQRARALAAFVAKTKHAKAG